MTMINDQDHELILDAGAQYYGATVRDKLNEKDAEIGGESWIDLLFLPYMMGEYYFQDKPKGKRHRVTWDLVADMFWQGFYAAQMEQDTQGDDEGDLGQI